MPEILVDHVAAFRAGAAEAAIDASMEQALRRFDPIPVIDPSGGTA